MSTSLSINKFTILNANDYFSFCITEVLWLQAFLREKLAIAWEFSKLDLTSCGESMRHTLVSIDFYTMNWQLSLNSEGDLRSGW